MNVAVDGAALRLVAVAAAPPPVTEGSGGLVVVVCMCSCALMKSYGDAWRMVYVNGVGAGA